MLTSMAEAWAERAGVVNLSRVVDMLVPGLWERVRSS
jgi:hypothetical protein